MLNLTALGHEWDTWGGITASAHNQAATSEWIHYLIFSSRIQPWRATNSSPRHKTRMPRLQAALFNLFIETPSEDLCQESLSCRTQSDECGTVLTAVTSYRSCYSGFWAELPAVFTLVCIQLRAVHTNCRTADINTLLCQLYGLFNCWEKFSQCSKTNCRNCAVTHHIVFCYYVAWTQLLPHNRLLHLRMINGNKQSAEEGKGLFVWPVQLNTDLSFDAIILFILAILFSAQRNPPDLTSIFCSYQSFWLWFGLCLGVKTFRKIKINWLFFEFPWLVMAAPSCKDWSRYLFFSFKFCFVWLKTVKRAGGEEMRCASSVEIKLRSAH